MHTNGNCISIHNKKDSETLTRGTLQYVKKNEIFRIVKNMNNFFYQPSSAAQNYFTK